MKKLKFNFLLFIIISIIKINSHSIFPGPKTEQEKQCINVTNPGQSECTAIQGADKQESCCYITYADRETGDKFSKCGYLENTEFGIAIYKNLYADYKEVKIICKSNYIKSILLINFFIILLLI